ncbi:MAG: protein kinase domain-containing protein [Blastocatellia bacterium]
MIGQTVSRYRILDKIGAGGMGEVFLAEDSSLGRKIAVKVLPERFTLDADRVRRFEQEAISASKLNHPNIITIYEVGTHEGSHFIATEFIEGETLRQQINDGQLTLVDALDVVIQVASGLQAAHGVGIAHRDIKPENIMVRPDGYVKILDFGLAKLTEQNSTGDLDQEAVTKSLFETQPGMVIGTLAYMSPEQARGQRVDGRTDIFSLGIVLYELVCGQRPFNGATPSDMIASLLVSEPPKLSAQSPNLPLDLERVVNRMLVKDREQRYQTAQDVINDLKRIKARLDLLGLGDEDAVETEETKPLEAPTAELPKPAEKPVEKQPVEKIEVPPADFGTKLLPVAEPANSQQSSPAPQPQSVEQSFETNITPAAVAPVVELASAPIPTTSPVQLAAETLPQVAAVTTSATATIAAPPKSRRKFLYLVIVAALIAAFFTWRATRANNVIDSIAVLPFINVTQDAEADYLTEGITESLINTLSQLPELSVSSRNAVIQYKGKEQDARKVGQEFGVKAVLVGRLTRRGNEVRVSAELVDASNGRQIWNDNFTRRTSDLLALQEEIAQKLAGKLSPRFAQGQSASLADVGTKNSEAYELYLKGRFYWNQGTPEALKKADEFFEAAAGMDSKYAEAFAGCAACHAVGSDGGTPQESMTKAKQVALAALKNDDKLVDAHLTLAAVNFRYDWDFVTAEREFKRAIELESKNPTAHQRYAEFLALMGRHKEANTAAWKARELDPRSLSANQTIGAIQYYAKDYDHAAEHLKKTLALDDKFAPAHTSLGLVFEQTGKRQEAVVELLRAKLLSGENAEYLTSLKKAFSESKETGFWRKELEHLNAEAKQRYVASSSVAALHTRLGENDLALAALEKGFSERDGGMVELNAEPVFEPLRKLPKFTELLKRIGLTE